MSAMFHKKVLPPSKQLRVYSKGNVDLISKLPECLLLNILCFLPVSDLVRTSVLSKGWRYLWNQIPNLDFDQYLFINCLHVNVLSSGCSCQCHERKIGKFAEFIDQMLLFHHGHTILKFRLSFCFNEHFRYTERIDRWVCYALTNKVHELILDFSVCYTWSFLHNFVPYHMPHHPFAAPVRLTVLKLHFCEFNFSSFEALSLLRSLFLRRVVVLDGSIGLLIASCPLLQDLSLESCHLPDKFMNHPLDLKLKTLTVENCRINGLVNPQVEGARWIDLMSSNRPVDSFEISAPNLLSFKFCGESICKLSLKSMSRLVDAEISIDQGSVLPGQSKILHKLLKQLDHAQALTLCSWFIQVLPLEGNQQSLATPLDNLKHLKLKVGLDGLEFLGMACLLSSARNLESLVLTMGDFACIIWDYLDIEVLNVFNYDDGLYWDSQMLCFNCLKKIEIYRFSGRKQVMDMIKFLLKNSVVLENVIICSDKKIYSDTKPEYDDTSRLQIELNSFHRASPRAKILFL
ncbi:hypothetical protein NE237_029292 [Protea cynaroides]|uniref:F-box domain-containing protein n=1 Tax=Protea cynaroides TaxID=273540 RepID=A0A9Q0JVY4_9MAGN|nr:hypothetical protein NE237_029292 [Protea cynaroides]